MMGPVHDFSRKPSKSAADEDVADLFFGQEQGMLLYLLGSDSEYLSHGNACFDTVLDKYSSHPLATYVRLIKGINAGRVFKSIDTKARKMRVRKPKPEESVKLLSSVVDVAQSISLDAITLDEVKTEAKRWLAANPMIVIAAPTATQAAIAPPAKPKG